VVDSLRTMLLHETGRLPVFYFPLSDVRDDLLEPTGRSVEIPVKGVASLPRSRIDVFKSTRHVRVSLGGEPLADSRRPKVLYETALPPRFYLPADDVRTELLVASPRRTRCAYKGSASYWHVRLGDRLVEDLVWTYRDPQHDATLVADHLCFFNEGVDLEVEGERMERPRTQWSRDED
jgi:uncharacterized protein (DUF427 family)